MDKPKVFLSFRFFAKDVIDRLQEKADLIFHENNPPDLQIAMTQVEGSTVICSYPRLKVGKEMMDAAGPHLKAIVTISSGTDHIDLEEAKRRGISVGCVRGVNNEAVADHAVMLALAAARRVRDSRVTMESKNEYLPASLYGKDVVGSTVGVVGLGEIGQKVIRRLSTFSVSRFLYCGRKEKPEAIEYGAEFVPFDYLVRESDFVFITCALNEETRELFDAEVFSKMKNSAVLVNVARGEIIKQDDLVEALKKKEIFAAGLDVFAPEPLPAGHELFSLTNCILTPHIAFATENVRKAMVDVTIQNIFNGLEGKEMVIKPL